MGRRLRGAAAGRGIVFFPAAAYVVHDARYRLAYGAHASQELAAQGHGYLDSVVPWLGLILAVGFGLFVCRVTRVAAGRGEVRARRPFAAVWPLTSLGLITIYTLQEAIEGILAEGHPGGVEGIFGHGGAWAIPVAVAAGLVIALFLTISHAVIRAISRSLEERAPHDVDAMRSLRPAPVFPARRAPLAEAPCRAPPAWLAADVA
jgi:hypothetical protein